MSVSRTRHARPQETGSDVLDVDSVIRLPEPRAHAAEGDEWVGRAIADKLTSGQVKLNLGGSVHDPTGPVGRLLFNVLAMVAEFESDLARMRTREGMKVVRAKGRLRGKRPKLSPNQEAHLISLYRGGGHTVGEHEELFSVTRSTVYRAIRRSGGSLQRHSKVAHVALKKNRPGEDIAAR